MSGCDLWVTALRRARVVVPEESVFCPSGFSVGRQPLWQTKSPTAMDSAGERTLKAFNHAKRRASIAGRVMRGIHESTSSDIFRQYGQMPR